MTHAVFHKTRVSVKKGDITKLDVDAFVYDIKSNLKLGSGIGGAISIRGGPSIQEELDALGTCPVGEAVITAGGKLKASYIIHAVGPKYQEEDEEPKMEAAVRSALERAKEKGMRRIAFPPMGAGMYFFPLDKCVRILVSTVKEFVETHPGVLDEVIFCTVDSREYAPFAREIEAFREKAGAES